MASPRYVDLTPRWMKNADNIARLADTPHTGFEPEYAPRLPTRVVPIDDSHSISAITLVDTIQITQKIVNYSAQEAAFGIQFEFSDLRSVPTSITDLAKLRIEPFESGSFVIPATLDDRAVSIENSSISNKQLSSRDILSRFVTALEGVSTGPEFPASIGLVNAVDELGRVLRREASAIEYYPGGFSRSERAHRVSIDATYIGRVKRNLNRRQDIKETPDALDGLLIAVDIPKATFRLRLSDNSEVRGNYEKTAANIVENSLNKRVTLQGVVGRRHRRVDYIRAIICEPIE